MNLTGIIIVSIILIAYTLFLRYRERVVFFKKNNELLDKLSNIESSNRFDGICVTFKILKTSASLVVSKVYFLNNAIALIDDFSADLNKNSKQYANTYLISRKGNRVEINENLFRNVALITNFEITNDGKIKLKVESHEQSMFRFIGFYSNLIKIEIEFKLPLEREEIITRFSNF